MTHGAIRAEYETSTESPQAGAVRRLTDEAALKITAKPEQQQAINDAVEYAIEKGVIARADCDAAIAYANREAIGIVPNTIGNDYAAHLGLHCSALVKRKSF